MNIDRIEEIVLNTYFYEEFYITFKIRFFHNKNNRTPDSNGPMLYSPSKMCAFGNRKLSSIQLRKLCSNFCGLMDANSFSKDEPFRLTVHERGLFGLVRGVFFILWRYLQKVCVCIYN